MLYLYSAPIKLIALAIFFFVLTLLDKEFQLKIDLLLLSDHNVSNFLLFFANVTIHVVRCPLTIYQKVLKLIINIPRSLLSKWGRGWTDMFFQIRGQIV